MSVKNRSFIIFAALAALLATQTASFAAETINYTYDGMGRLTKATYGDGTKVAYTYDAMGNRTHQTVTVPAKKIAATPSVVKAK